jgi:hypothetical protein
MIELKTRLVIDTGPLRKRWLAKRRKVLFSAGGYALKVFIRQPLRSGKASAVPGATPKSHTKALKKNSAFDVDVEAGEMLAGFTTFPSAVAEPIAGATIPGALFKGGKVRIDAPAKTITRPDGRQKLIAPKSIVADYEPRPALLEDGQKNAGAKTLELIERIPL